MEEYTFINYEKGNIYLNVVIRKNNGNFVAKINFIVSGSVVLSCYEMKEPDEIKLKKYIFNFVNATVLAIKDKKPDISGLDELIGFLKECRMVVNQLRLL